MKTPEEVGGQQRRAVASTARGCDGRPRSSVRGRAARSNGQSWRLLLGAARLGRREPGALEHPALEVGHPGDHLGIGEVVGVTATSSSPETPVASSSWSTFSSSGRSRGDELADVGDHLGPGAHRPAERPRAPAPTASTRPGAATDAAERPAPERATRAPTSRRAPASVANAPGRAEPARAERRRTARAGRPAPGQRERGEPDGQGEREGDRDPGDEQEPEAAHHRDRREQQDQEAGRGRERGGGDHRAAARGRLDRRPRRRASPCASASTKRA